MADMRKDQDAEYIASLCADLAKLAERNGFSTGLYLLKMAELEFANLAIKHRKVCDASS